MEQLNLAPEAPVVARNRKVRLGLIVVEDMTALEATVDHDLVNSIRELGVLEPVILESRGAADGRFDIIDGRRRTVAAFKAGLKSIPARIVEVDGWLGREVLSILLNEQRGPNPVSELAAIERLISAGKSVSQITRATGMDAGTIRKRLKLTKLIPVLREALECGQIKVALAEGISALPEALQVQLAVKGDIDKLTGTDLREVREVRHEHAAALLIDAVSQTAATTTLDPADERWEVEVFRLLDQAIHLIPEKEGWAWSPLSEVHNQLNNALKEEAS